MAETIVLTLSIREDDAAKLKAAIGSSAMRDLGIVAFSHPELGKAEDEEEPNAALINSLIERRNKRRIERRRRERGSTAD